MINLTRAKRRRNEKRRRLTSTSTVTETGRGKTVTTAAIKVIRKKLRNTKVPSLLTEISLEMTTLKPKMLRKKNVIEKMKVEVILESNRVIINLSIELLTMPVTAAAHPAGNMKIKKSLKMGPEVMINTIKTSTVICPVLICSPTLGFQGRKSQSPKRGLQIPMILMIVPRPSSQGSLTPIKSIPYQAFRPPSVDLP